VAPSGRQALQLSRRTPVDLVLMDIRLKGGMDGIQAARAMRRERDVPIVYVTAYADTKTIERAKTAGAFGYIVKPIRDASLRAVVEISLHKHRLERGAARELEQTREKCEALSGRLNVAKENECRRLAQELHDDVQQRLTAIALELEIQHDEPGLPPESRAVMHEASLKLRQLSRDLHRLSHDLHPRVLEELGLVAAIQRLCRECGRRGLNVHFRHESLPASVPAAVATCLYRVVQESLQNVIKHAGTAEAMVLLAGTPSGIGLRVSDRGAGFDPASVGCGSPIGLRNMSDRVESVGGSLDVSSEPGKGTKISVSIPLAGNHL
jgi:signal transduction histidine kinase